jgi:hypothetical protein
MTMIAVLYTVIGPRKLSSFYHIYAEVLLEFFVFLFWLSSFASMAFYVSATNWIPFLDSNVSNDPSINSSVNAALAQDPFYQALLASVKSFKAVTAFGAVLL